MAEQDRQTVALTGSTGFIGRALTRRLLDSGHSVRVLTRRPVAGPDDDNLTRITSDLGSSDALDELCHTSDCLIHLAGAIAGESVCDFVRTNAVGTRNVADSLERANPGARLLHISSLAARRPALSPYAYSKHLSEQIVRSSNLNWLILRPPAIYGPTDPALAALWKMLARGWLIQTGPEAARFSLLHVDDLCRALCQLIQQPWPSARTVCLDDRRPGGYSWRDIRDIAVATSGRRIRTVKLHPNLLLSVALLNEKTRRLTGGTPMLSRGKVRELTHPDWVCGDNIESVLPNWLPQQQLSGALPELPGWINAI